MKINQTILTQKFDYLKNRTKSNSKKKFGQLKTIEHSIFEVLIIQFLEVKK